VNEEGEHMVLPNPGEDECLAVVLP
jgi:hypothetical protein